MGIERATWCEKLKMEIRVFFQASKEFLIIAQTTANGKEYVVPFNFKVSLSAGKAD